ncbi:hypothetical protein WDU94_015572 [Cyamophila willieti]
MEDTPKYTMARSLRSKVDTNSCFPLSLTNDYVYDFAIRLDTQVKKCIETTDVQEIKDLVPIIVETLTSLDEYSNELADCQRKRDALQEKLKTKNVTIKQLKQQLDVECKAHQDTILDSDTQILELTEEKRLVEEDYKTLKNKITTDRINIDRVNKRIGELTNETNEVTNNNEKLRESIQNLRTRLNHLQVKVSKSKTPPMQQVPSTSSSSQTDFNTQARTIHVLGDSNVRGLGLVIRELSGHEKIKVLTSCIPGGGLCQLNNAFIEYPENGDVVIIHAGTNDICKTEWSDIKQSLTSLVTKYQHCKIVVFTVPPRCDYPYLNKHINKFNTLLKYEVGHFKNVQLVVTKRLIKPDHMKADGIHYNSKGREKIARKIMSVKYFPTVPYARPLIPSSGLEPDITSPQVVTITSPAPTPNAMSPPQPCLIQTRPTVTTEPAPSTSTHPAPTTQHNLLLELEESSFFD